MSYYPIYLDLKGRAVLVVGGGTVAQDKTERLIKAGARVHLVSPELTLPLSQLTDSGVILYRRGEFLQDDLTGVILVISATNCRTTNERVARAAAERGLLCNVVDQPALCNFITPAVIERGRLQISISTGGGSPSLAQRVKREVAALIDEEYGELLEIVAALRRDAHHWIVDYESRRELLRAFVESEALEMLHQGRREEAEQLARKMLERFLVHREVAAAI